MPPVATIHRFSSRIKQLLRPYLLDIGSRKATIMLAGMGRSGTTWAADLINHDGSHRVLFEPFFPARVEQARSFKYLQYLSPHEHDAQLVEQAGRILAGEPINDWIDRDNPGLFYRRRILKDIRCNLMLGWLAQTFPHLSIVLLVRHPLAVTASWLELGWGREADGERTDVAILMAQRDLLRDFEVIEDAARQVNLEDPFEATLLEWCILHHVPLHHLRGQRACVIAYENLVLDPEREVKRLFSFLDVPYDWAVVQLALRRTSSTNFLSRDHDHDRLSLVTGWKNAFSDAQVTRADELLALFGLNALYDADGRPVRFDALP